MRPSLADSITRASIRRISDESSFERGEEYFESGSVRDLIQDGERIIARVSGTRLYRVELRMDRRNFEWSCTCPHASGNEVFCKHCVAVALTWLKRKRPGTGTKSEDGATLAMDDLKTWLAGKEKAALVGLITDKAREDGHFRDKLFLQAALSQGKPNLARIRQSIKGAIQHGGSIDYYEAQAYFEGINAAIDALDELMKYGHAGSVVDLAGEALVTVAESVSSVDDSDGGTSQVLARLQDLHLRACEQARPDARSLAAWLIECELTSDLDILECGFTAYAKVLGKKGHVEYRRLAEIEWAKVPALGPGEKDPDRYGRRYRIRRIMEDLAQGKGRLERLVKIKARDLSEPAGFLEIARLYLEAGNHDQALEWAERGFKEFSDRPHEGLRELVASEYRRRGRHDEALALMWEPFEKSPDLPEYRALKEFAVQAGAWPEWRRKALAHIRATIKRAGEVGREDRSGWRSAGNSRLVDIFIWEGDVDAAWKEAQAGGCAELLWQALAALREKEHPEDAFPIYQRSVDRLLRWTGDNIYKDAVGFLGRVRGLMNRLGLMEEWGIYLATVRSDHGRKRNLLKLLDHAGLR